MSKERESFQQRSGRAQPPCYGSNPGYQHPDQQQPYQQPYQQPGPSSHGQGVHTGSNFQPGQIYNQQAYQQPIPSSHGQDSNLQPGQTYNMMMPGTCAVPGPVANPLYPQPKAAPLRVSEEKTVIEAYLVWLILGLIGGHHFYLRRYGFGVVYFFTFGLAGAGYVIDMFRMPYLVSMANKRRADPSLDNKKNISDAYTLWFPFGLLGYHHHYLGNHGLGVLYLFTCGWFGIGWLIDLVRIPYLVKDYNTKTKVELQEKSVCTAYILGALPTGLFGSHHFYLGRPLWGFVYFCTFGLLGVGWIVDWFRIPILVARTNKELVRNQKDETKYLDDAYVLWFPFGLIGSHHLYLERWGWAAFYFFTFGAFGLGWIIDGFRMPCLVEGANKRKQEQLLIPSSFLAHSGQTIATPYTGSNPGQQPAAHAYHPQQPPQQQQPVNPPSYQYAAPTAPSYMEQPPPYTATWEPKEAI